MDIYISADTHAKLYGCNKKLKYDICYKTRVIEQIPEIEYNVKNKKIGWGYHRKNNSLFCILMYKNQERRQLMTIINELDSTCGISDEELTLRFKASIRIDNEVRKIKGLPIAGYDDETKKAYLEYPDGRREYVGE